MNHSLNQKFRALEKLLNAGFVDEKSILNMKLEDLLKMPNLTTIEVNIIIELKKSIKDKTIITFLSNSKNYL